MSKFGLRKVGASTMASLIFSNAYFLSFVHLKLESFLIISCSGLTISTKSEMNLLTKFIFPRKDYMVFLLWGNTIALMASILPGSIVIPSGEITNLSKVPSSIENMLFFGFKDILYPRHLSNITFKCGMCSSQILK